MLTKIQTFIKYFIFACIGGFVGKSIFAYIHYINHPGFYEIQSAPWYTEILVSLFATGIIILIVFIIYLLIGRKIKKDINHV